MLGNPAGRARDFVFRGRRSVYLLRNASTHQGPAAVAALVEWAAPETLPALRERFAAEKDAANRLDLVRAVAGMKAPAATDFLVGVLRDRTHAAKLREAALGGLAGLKTSLAEKAI